MKRLVLIFVLAVTGCAHSLERPIARDELVGVYANGDPFWPRSLDLNSDGTFAYRQLTDVIGADGSFEGSWGLSGKWRFVTPDRVELATAMQKEPVLVFARRSKRSGIAILEPDLFPAILREWADDAGFGYLRKSGVKKPNQTPEPTPTAVTPRADARVAPAAVVAHL